MKFRTRPSEDPELNLVPLIDVLLMTLIFLVTLGACAGSISRILDQKPRISELIATFSGSILMLLGVRLLVPESK